jgi:hypothetical protein
MTYKLVLQWPAVSLSDYEGLIATEELISNALSEKDATVDGHDMGSGEMNIFIFTDFPEAVFVQIRQILEKHVLETARVAYKGVGEAEYIVLWPNGQKSFKVV